jgi:methylated-DNA-[protein]-cysteine S-methyltransferase
MAIVQIKMKSKHGDIFLVASEKGLRSLYWKREADLPKPDRGSAEEKILLKVVSQLEDYFAGNLRAFDIPLDLIGTDFQKKVWQQLLEIPYGKTISYAELAKRVGNPLASRAVGTANGRNPISVIVPCHRVIASDGGMGGYSGGLPVKAYLLDLEKAMPTQSSLF